MTLEAGFPLQLKLDLHVHTNRSSDAFTSPKQLAIICRDRGLDGLAITDHNVLSVTWKRARKFAKRENYAMTAGSDSHIPETVGRAYTEMESTSKDTASVLAALKSGRVSPVGGPIRVSERVRKMFHGRREEN